MPQNTIKTVYNFSIHLLNLHHLVYSKALASWKISVKPDSSSLHSLSSHSHEHKWLHKLCGGKLKALGLRPRQQLHKLTYTSRAMPAWESLKTELTSVWAVKKIRVYTHCPYWFLQPWYTLLSVQLWLGSFSECLNTEMYQKWEIVHFYSMFNQIEQPTAEVVTGYIKRQIAALFPPQLSPLHCLQFPNFQKIQCCIIKYIIAPSWRKCPKVTLTWDSRDLRLIQTSKQFAYRLWENSSKTLCASMKKNYSPLCKEV